MSTKNDSLARRDDESRTTASSDAVTNARLQAVVVFAMVGLLGFFGYRSDTWTAATAAGACLAALLLLRFSSIGKLEALGVKVENATREAHEATEEAKATVSQVRKLASEVGRIGLDQLALRNRLGVLPPRAMLRARNRVTDALEVAGCSAPEVTRAAKLLNDSIGVDFGQKIEGALLKSTPGDEPRHKSVRSLIGKTFTPVPTKELRPLIPDGEPGADARKLLADYERYEKTGEVPSTEDDGNYFRDDLFD